MRSLLKRPVVFLWLLAVLLIPFGAKAADDQTDVDHGAVRILDYDYVSLTDRLAAKYPSVFPMGKVYVDGSEVGTTLCVRVLLSNSATHRQADNYGVTMKFINGATRGTANAGYGFGQFQNNEQFTVDSHISYCFDWTTPAKAGQHSVSATLAEAGIQVRSGLDVIALAESARMLTENNYQLITDNAAALAKTLQIPAYTDPDNAFIHTAALTVPAADVARLLRDTTADGLAFKRGLVQFMVWQKMNDMSLGDWLYSFLSSTGYFNKEGVWVPSGGPSLTAPLIGYGALIDFPAMYALGLNAWRQAETSSSSQADAEWQYTLTVGQPFTVPTADAEGIGKILAANGGKIDPEGKVAVNVSADGRTITLTASSPIENWTAWQGTSDSSRIIYSSKPYNPSYRDANGQLVTGSGQFIVDVGAMRYYRARVRAPLTDGYLALQKLSASPAITDGNSAYSLAGAVYGVYATAQHAGTDTGRLTTLTTDASGRSSAVRLTAGTYYVKELTAPAGYAADAQVHSVTVTTTNTESNPATLRIDERPLAASVGLILTKTDSRASDLTLAGAQFTFRFYAAAEASGQPQAVWVFETDSAGQIRLTEEHKVSGSALFILNGTPVIPVGTLTIEETEAPAGYLRDESIRTVHFRLDSASGHVLSDAPGALLHSENGREDLNFALGNAPVLGGITVRKTDAVSGEGPVPGADFSGIRFAVLNNGEQAVFVGPDALRADPGFVAAVLTLDESGSAATEADWLPAGRYLVTELRRDAVAEAGAVLQEGTSLYANGSYYWAENRFDLTLTENGVILAAGIAEDVPALQKVRVIKTSGDGKPAGLTFLLKGVASLTDEAVERRAVTDEEGIADFGYVPIGTYTVSEEDVPAQYIPPEPQEFEVTDRDVTLFFENRLIPETTAEETTPEETTPEETTPEETTPEETTPEETTPEETTPEETTPEETTPEETLPPETTPEETAPPTTEPSTTAVPVTEALTTAAPPSTAVPNVPKVGDESDLSSPLFFLLSSAALISAALLFSRRKKKQ